MFYLQRTLSRKIVSNIVDIRLKEVKERLADRKMRLAVSPEAKESLASVGYSPIYGARPLNRAIQAELLNPLYVLSLENAVRDGETIQVEFDGPHDRLSIKPDHASGRMANGMDVDWENPDDDIEIEEME